MIETTLIFSTFRNSFYFQVNLCKMQHTGIIGGSIGLNGVTLRKQRSKIYLKLNRQKCYWQWLHWFAI